MSQKSNGKMLTLNEYCQRAYLCLISTTLFRKSNNASLGKIENLTVKSVRVILNNTFVLIPHYINSLDVFDGLALVGHRCDLMCEVVTTDQIYKK